MMWQGGVKVRRMVALALYAGLRCHEIAQIDCADVWVDIDDPIVVVRNGKGAKDRAVPLHGTLCGLLADIPRAGPLFPGRDHSRPMRAKSVARAITRHMEMCGVDGTPHQLRHTFGTGVARASNGNMVLTAELMGHESMNTTMGYVRLAQAGGAAVIGKIYERSVA